MLILSLISFLGSATNESEWVIIAFSSIPDFNVRLPAGDDRTSLLHLSVRIRDNFGCIVQVNLSTVTVRAETEMINDLIDQIQTSQQNLNHHSLVRLLSSRSQNMVSQVLNSLSVELNRMTDDNLEEAISSNYSSLVPLTSS